MIKINFIVQFLDFGEMKIALITLHTPTATNHRGASALPYHIIKYRNIDIETEIWTYNINECSAELITQTEETLNVKIHLVPKNQMMGILESRLLRFFCRIQSCIIECYLMKLFVI